MTPGAPPPPLDLSRLPPVSTIAQSSETSQLSDDRQPITRTQDEDVQRLESDIERTELALQEAENSIRDLQDKNLKLKGQLIEAEKKVDRYEILLQQHQDSLGEQSQKFKNQSIKMERELDLLKSEVRDLTLWKDKAASLTKQLERYRNEIERLSDAASRVAEVENELESKSILEAELQRAMKEVEELKANVESLRDKLASKTAEAYALESSEAATKEQLNTLRLELERTHLAKQEMEIQVEDLVRKNTQGKSTVNVQAQIPMATLNGSDTVASLRQKVWSLEKELAASKDSGKMKELEENCALLERTNKILRDKVEEYICKTSSTSPQQQPPTHLSQDRLLQSLRDCEASNKALHVLYSRLLAQCGLEILKLRALSASTED